jgi:hypothetical protein
MYYAAQVEKLILENQIIILQQQRGGNVCSLIVAAERS